MTVQLSGDEARDFFPVASFPEEQGEPALPMVWMKKDEKLTEGDDDGFDMERAQYEAVERAHDVFFSEPTWR